MYHSYFGLRELPFSIAVDPRYLFMSDRHRDALAHLLYGVGVGGGFILLTGEVGTGKTTINRCVLEQLPDRTDVALILNPALDAVGLLAAICDELAMVYSEREHTLKGLTDRLHGFLLANHQRGRSTVLLIDEAQHLKPEVLEQIRLLTNLETNTQKLLQIILVGQPELKTMLDRPELRQLSQRITARYQLKPLSLAETQAYIDHRLQVAGLPAGQRLFPRHVVKRIHRESGGIPRLINVYCDRALLGAYGQHRGTVDLGILRQALREVNGEEPTGIAGSLGWGRSALAVATLLVLVGTARWWHLHSRQPSEVADALPMEVPAGASAQVSPQAPDVNDQRALAVADGSNGEASPAVTAPPPAATVPAPAVPVRGTRAQALNALLLRQGDLSEAVADPCSVLGREGWRCDDLRLDDWSGLLAIDRPVVLQQRDDSGRLVWVALLEMVGDEGVLVADDGVLRLPLKQLGENWTGALTLPWRAPAGFSRSLLLGSEGPAVAWLSESFAKLDGQERGLSDGVYNDLLEQRVRLFQRQENLLVDGIAGLATVLRLDQRVGRVHGLVREVAASGGEN